MLEMRDKMKSKDLDKMKSKENRFGQAHKNDGHAAFSFAENECPSDEIYARERAIV